MLPKVLDGDWWDKGVLIKLSDNQRNIVNEKKITTLNELDLSALLRITDRNWYSIRNKCYLNYSERMTISKMFGVRNNWAHISTVPPSSAQIINDLKTIKDFMSFLNIDRANINEFEKLINEIKEKGINDIGPTTPNEISLIEPVKVAPKQIKMNSIVRLISNPDSTGVVIGTGNIGNTVQYTVFIEGKQKNYFEGQIELIKENEETDNNNIIDVQRIITAYQIKKPSSDNLYSLNSARIDFVPYQFRPALKIIKSDTPRLLIADGVGVGKTMEAGLIMKELQARASLNTVIIICPRPLVAERKWETEMKRFDEDFTPVTDGDMFREIIMLNNRDGEWPERYKRLIIPYSLLRDDLLGKRNKEEPKPDKENKKKRKLPISFNFDPIPHFDMVIVDEAHHVRNSGTQAHEIVEYFCKNADAAVFLTATPLQLGNKDLYTLLKLLYPEIIIDLPTFNTMVEPNSYINSAIHHLRISNHEKDALEQLENVVTTDWGKKVIAPNPIYQDVVTTLANSELTREQRVKLISDVETLHSFANMINRTRRQDIEDFCIRRAYTIESEFTEEQHILHDALLEFVAEILSVRHPSISLKFLMCTIRRQAASCIFGLAKSIQNITQRQIEKLTDEYDFPDDFDISSIDDKYFDIINQKSKELIKLAENLPKEDIKFEKLVEIIQERQNRENNKMIIFSTFLHTLDYLYKNISEIGNIRVAYVNGSVKDEERYKCRERFALLKNDPMALDILLFTEVGSEGLDYQFCDTIVNYDLPWNPMRIEQRIGRIDRRGQKSDVAHIYNCITKDTVDEEIFERCLKRIGVFESSIGDCSEILGELVKSIEEIFLDPKLTKEERELRLEQLADNKIREIQEINRLEDDEKHLFGVDILSFIDDIYKADNPWLSSEALYRLITGYLDKRLSTNEPHISDNKLRLKTNEKIKLAEDYKLLNNVHDLTWQKYLNSSYANYKIAFDQDTAKDPKTLFITPTHPLVQQAANLYFSHSASQITILTNSSDISPGEYPFQFYMWEFTSGKPRTKLIPVCLNVEAQKELSTIMQFASPDYTPKKDYKSEWTKLAEEHLKLWQTEREKFKNDAESLCRFKIESLSRSIEVRKSIAKKQIDETSDEKILKMRESEIQRLEREFLEKKQRFEDTARLADIHTTLLVNGVLIVKEE
jgi:ERCC4-related helicase